ncbi:MAG: lipopolysaccharide biosynthesis protein [Agathobacter sp.]
MKKINISTAAKSTLAYTFASLFSKGIAFITIPFFTRIMTTDQIGVVNIYNSWFSLIYVFSTMSLTSGGYQVALKKFEKQRNAYISSVVSITSLIAISIIIIMLLFCNCMEKVMGLPRLLIGLMGIGLLVSPAMDFWLAKERYEYKYKVATIVTIFSACFATIVSLLVVYKINNSAIARLCTNFFIIYGIDFIILIIILLKGKCFYNKDFWVFSLQLGIPMIAYSISAQVLNVSDRLMINKYVGESAVGIYGTLYSISTISLILWNALNASFVPFLHKNIEHNRHKIQSYSVMLLLLYALFAVLITYFSPEIVRIFATAEYYEAIYIMPPIAAGISMMAISNMYSNVLLYYQKTGVIMVASVSAALVNVVLNALCIPRYGYMVAAYTTMIAYIFLAFLQGAYVCIKQLGVSDTNMERVYNDRKIFCTGLLCIVACMFGLLLYANNFIRYIAILLLIIASIVLIIKKSYTEY